MIASASARPDHIASNTSLAILPEMVPSTMRCEQPGKRIGADRRLRDLEPVPVQESGKLAHDPVRRELRLARRRRDDALVEVGDLAARSQHAGVVLGQAVLAHEARGLRIGQLRQALAHAAR